MIFHQPHNSLSNYNYNAFTYTGTTWDYHFHRNFELIYVIRGSVDCTVNNKRYLLSKGEFGLCLPYDLHSYVPKENSIYWVLVFSEDYIRYLANQLSGKKGDGFKFCCEPCVETLIKEKIIATNEPSVLCLKSCLYAVLETYLSNIKLVEKSTKESDIISYITDYVNDHHTENLTLSSLAKKLGYDYNYMSRYFHNTFNINFSDFVNIYRLETATKLLESTSESITSIAFKSGFQSMRAFNSFFKKTTNLTPSQYRKASRN